MKIRPLNDRILVVRVEEEKKTAGGIIIPDTAKEKPQEGKVVAAGPGKLGENGKRIPLDVKKGDRVLFLEVRRHRDQGGRRRAPLHARRRHSRNSRITDKEEKTCQLK